MQLNWLKRLGKENLLLLADFVEDILSAVVDCVTADVVADLGLAFVRFLGVRIFLLYITNKKKS